MRVFVVFSLVLLAAFALAQGSGEGAGLMEEQERPRVLCGRNLAKARMLYCDSESDSDTRKRFSEAPLAGSMYPSWQSWWWTRQMRRAQEAHALRGKRNPGIVDECCYKPCYLSELLNYC